MGCGLKVAKPQSAKEHSLLGSDAFRSGDYLIAQSEFAAALAANPSDFDAMQGMAIILFQTGRHEAGLLAAKRAAALAPNASERGGAYNNLGYFLGMLGRLEESKAALLKSVEALESPISLHHLGLALYSLGEFEEAVEVYDRALKIAPPEKHEELIDQRGTAQLGAGHYVEGLIDNKVRWGVLKSHPLMHSATLPEWKGEPLDGKSIIVLHEQGFGDTFQFVRFVPRLRELGAARVILSVRDECADLIRVSGLADEVIGIRESPEGGLASVDYKCPMLTVPAHLGLTVATIPGEPYIKAPLREKKLAGETRFKVGLVWAGKAMYAADHWRSMPITNLLPLLENEACAFYSLQQDERKKELWESGLNAFMTDLSGQLRDWSDTAAILTEIDLLVSVDTAPAHLAGALGIPVALMIPQASCWRWLNHSSTMTPWYPSMMLHRQVRQGDWSPVIASVSKRLPWPHSI